jgi:hypothetical protein
LRPIGSVEGGDEKKRGAKNGESGFHGGNSFPY